MISSKWSEILVGRKPTVTRLEPYQVTPRCTRTPALEEQIYSQVPVVLLYYGGSWGLFQTTHFTGWPSAQDPYALPTNYDASILEVVTHLKKT